MAVSAYPSFCGKFILGGEHSVVYKGQALAIPLSQLRLSIESIEESHNTSGTPGLWVNGTRHSSEHWELLQALVRMLKGPSAQIHSLHLRSTIPIGAGLGSSAALCATLAKYFYPELNGVELAKLALSGERVFHAKPSGVDPYVVALEKPIVFQAQSQSYRELDLNKFHDSGLKFVIVNTSQPHNTAKVIEKVSSLKEELPLLWSDLIDALSQNADRMAHALEQSPRLELGKLMNDTHFRLVQLGVSIEEIDDLVKNLRKAGALGAKLTGAGLGGAVVALFEADQIPALKQEHFVV